MKEERAKEVADKLQNVSKWHVHGRGIRRAVLEKEINIIIDDFSKDQALAKAIKDYCNLLQDYMATTGVISVLHSRGRYVPLRWGR